MDVSEQQFYDKVARKFGGYKSKAVRKNNFPSGDPEEIFLEQLVKYAEKSKVALDIGCADGRFTLKVAENFNEIFAIDVSTEMLTRAEQLKGEQKIPNVVFQKADAEKLPFQDGYFDVVYSRRGPSPYAEISRVVKRGGYYAEICIGEQDAKELKVVFGRGQDFGKWDIPVSKTKVDTLIARGFKVVFVRDYFYSEIFPDMKNLDIYLQGIPIFKDFDSVKDKDFLALYTGKMKIPEGIELKRHRVIIVAEKS